MKDYVRHTNSGPAAVFTKQKEVDSCESTKPVVYTENRCDIVEIIQAVCFFVTIAIVVFGIFSL